MDAMLHDWKFLVFAGTLLFNAGIMFAAIGYLRVTVKQLKECIEKIDDRQDAQESRLIKLEAEHRVFHRGERAETHA